MRETGYYKIEKTQDCPFEVGFYSQERDLWQLPGTDEWFSQVDVANLSASNNVEIIPSGDSMIMPSLTIPRRRVPRVNQDAEIELAEGFYLCMQRNESRFIDRKQYTAARFLNDYQVCYYLEEAKSVILFGSNALFDIDTDFIYFSNDTILNILWQKEKQG